jgi:hypothetical protein
VVLLLDCCALSGGPVHVTIKSVPPCAHSVVVGLLPLAVGAVMLQSDWMEPLGLAVGAHVPEFLHLGVLACTVSTTFASTSACIWIFILIVELGSNECDGGRMLLDLGLHRHQFILCVDVDGFIGCIGCTHAG